VDAKVIGRMVQAGRALLPFRVIVEGRGDGSCSQTVGRFRQQAFSKNTSVSPS